MNPNISTDPANGIAAASDSTDNQHSVWDMMVFFTLTLWLGASLLLDLLIMPGLYVTGMTSEPSFVLAGHLIFCVFNRAELVSAALVLTGVLILKNTSNSSKAWPSQMAMSLSLLLLVIPLIYTYGLTPQMSAFGVQLNLFETTTSVSTGMNQLHQAYWGLEILKLLVSGTLLIQLFSRAKAVLSL